MILNIEYYLSNFKVSVNNIAIAFDNNVIRYDTFDWLNNCNDYSIGTSPK